MARSKKKNPETKNKEDAIVVPGQVVECLPQTKFRVLLETGQEIIAYTSGRLYRFRIRIFIGVAPNPRCSRSWFSRYRMYVRGSFLFTKSVNVGGSVAP